MREGDGGKVCFFWFRGRGTGSSTRKKKCTLTVFLSLFPSLFLSFSRTSTNLVVSGLQQAKFAKDPSQAVFGFFDITPFGAFPFSPFSPSLFLFSFLCSLLFALCTAATTPHPPPQPRQHRRKKIEGRCLTFREKSDIIFNVNPQPPPTTTPKKKKKLPPQKQQQQQVCPTPSGAPST